MKTFTATMLTAALATWFAMPSVAFAQDVVVQTPAATAVVPGVPITAPSVTTAAPVVVTTPIETVGYRRGYYRPYYGYYRPYAAYRPYYRPYYGYRAYRPYAYGYYGPRYGAYYSNYGAPGYYW